MEDRQSDGRMDGQMEEGKDRNGWSDRHIAKQIDIRKKTRQAKRWKQVGTVTGRQTIRHNY